MARVVAGNVPKRVVRKIPIRGRAESDWLLSDSALVRRVKTPPITVNVRRGQRKQNIFGAREEKSCASRNMSESRRFHEANER